MFSASTTYGKQLRIEKTRLSHQVWSHGGSTLKKKDNKRPFFPPCRNWPIYEKRILKLRRLSSATQIAIIKVTSIASENECYTTKTKFKICLTLILLSRVVQKIALFKKAMCTATPESAQRRGFHIWTSLWFPIPHYVEGDIIHLHEKGRVMKREISPHWMPQIIGTMFRDLSSFSRIKESQS